MRCQKVDVEQSDLLRHLMMNLKHRIYNYGLVLTVYMLDCDKNVKRHIV
jgi:hypothetical protein